MDENAPEAFFYEIFDASLPRLGPGDADLTKRALDIVLSQHLERTGRRDTTDLRTLDIGCGNGGATLQLAKHLDGTIVAVDNHEPFLDELKRRAQADGVDAKIEPVLGDMNHLEMDDGCFDLIWSEGALSIMGLREGLSASHRLLAPGGFLGVSDLVWLKPEPPPECRQLFAAACPMMADNDATLNVMGDCGYDVLGHFAMPESAWWQPFYQPLEDRLRRLREKWAAEREKIELIESIQAQIDLYRKYSDYYGYVFYIMKRV